jgi:serine phosphatase RsbU (regulator of sigma subunit)/tetratricopeptide (TPR) repeat protein
MNPIVSRYCILVFVALFGAGVVHAQDKMRLREALLKLKTAKEDTNKVIWLNDVAWDSSYEDLSAGIKYGKQAAELAYKLHYARGYSKALNVIGATYTDMGDFSKALETHLENLRYCDSLNIQVMFSAIYMNLANVYARQNNYERNLYYLKKAIAECELKKADKGLSSSLNNLGVTYCQLDSLSKAREAFQRSVAIANNPASKLDNRQTQLLYALTGLSEVAAREGKFVEADSCIRAATAILDLMQSDYERAQAFMTFGGVRRLQKRNAESEYYFLKSAEIYHEMGMPDQESIVYGDLSEMYALAGNYKEGLTYYKKYMQAQDTLFSESIFRHQGELETLYESEKKDREIESLTQDESLNQIYLFGLIGGCVILTILAFLIWNRSKLRQRINDELAARKSIIVAKNKDITDSITYARRIQTAMLPPNDAFKNWFADSFVLNRPRDIVSGDFWWVNERDGELLFAGADCTGHGVPGGFMSVMGAAFLNEITTENEITDPAEVLGLLRHKVIGSLHQQGDQSRSQDGMDIVFCKYTIQTRQLEFACANNPLWIARDGKLLEFNADKFPVGIHHGDLKPFTKQTVVLEPNDKVYIFTDGFADQFGGVQGKKFKYKQLRDVLLANSTKTMREQHNMLEHVFDEWRGSLGQIDDVLILGIRIA